MLTETERDNAQLFLYQVDFLELALANDSQQC
jgi:hypothetical protein